MKPNWKKVAAPKEPQHFDLFMSCVEAEMQRGELRRKRERPQYRERPEPTRHDSTADHLVQSWLNRDTE